MITNLRDLTRAKLFKPELAAGVVALMGPGVPMTRINDMAQRGQIEHWGGGGSNNTPRLFSLASAIQIHGHYLANSVGMSPTWATQVGQKSLKRYLNSFDSGKPAVEEPYHHMLCWIKHDGEFAAIALGDDQLAYHYQKYGSAFPGDFQIRMQEAGLGIAPLSHFVLPVDSMNNYLLKQYVEVTPDFNQKALEGRLKPFPKHLG